MAVAGSPSMPQASKPALESQQPAAQASQAAPGSSLSSQEPSTSQQQTADDIHQQDAPEQGTAAPAQVEEEAESSSAGGQGVSAAELNSREAVPDSSQAAISGTPGAAPRASGLTREGYAEEGSARQPLDSKEQQGGTDEAEDATNRMLQSAGRGKSHLLAQTALLTRLWSCVSC